MSGFAITTYDPPAVGILSARLGSLQSSDIVVNKDITLGVNSDRYQTFFTPSQNIDQFALNELDTVNTKKSEIQDLGDSDTYYTAPRTFTDSASAITAVNDDYDSLVVNVGVVTALRFGSSASFTTGHNVTQQNTGAYGTVFVTANDQRVLLTDVSGPGSFNTTDDCAVGIGTTQYDPTDTQLGIPNQIRFAGFGHINNDLITISTYPNLEPINVNVSSPFYGKTVSTLGAGNTGVGFANTFFTNSGSFIGTVFAFMSSGAAGAATSISNIGDEIRDTLRPGITTFTDTSNIIKPYKIDFAVNTWSLERSKLENNLSMAGLSTAISILNDPQYGGPY